MEKSTSIMFRRGRRSSLAIEEELEVAEAELLDFTDESSEGVEEDGECDEIPAEVKLMYAVHEGDLEEIEELLVSGANVDYKDIDDRTALHVAACQGYKEVVELLIDHGADVDAVDKWGSTPLADAIHYKNYCVTTLLEKHGTVPSVKNECNVPEYEIDPQEIDFTNSIHATKGTLASWRGIEVSVKKVGDISIDEERRTAFRDELALLQRVRHPNVVQFLGAVTQSNQKMIVTEYFPKGDLRQYLKEKGQLKPRTAVKFALDIARGIGYLHENKPEAIIHGSLDPSNIMRDVSGNLKVADFGMSKLLRASKEVEEDGPDDSVECQSGRYMSLLLAICKVFWRYCQQNKIDLTGQNFTLSYDTNIPRQTGLSGSSAIVCAALNCLLDFYKIRHLIKVQERPNLILNAEKELGIVAGLQDRVAQVYGGLVYMEFNKEQMEEFGYGKYTPMDVSLLPTLHLIYAENPSDSGKVHSTVRQRWLDGDQLIRSSIEEVADIAVEGTQALLDKDLPKFAELMNRNFDLRRSMFGDDVLGAVNLEMVEVARRVGAASKFTGSGGAVVAYCPEGASQVERLEEACKKAGFIIQPVKVMPTNLNQIDLKTMSSP